MSIKLHHIFINFEDLDCPSILSRPTSNLESLSNIYSVEIRSLGQWVFKKIFDFIKTKHQYHTEILLNLHDISIKLITLFDMLLFKFNSI